MSFLRQAILTVGYRTKLINQIRHIWGAQRLTVLAYHRVTDPYCKSFDLFAPNVSATPEAFASQMAFVSRHFNVVALKDVLAWLNKERPLPINPLLITFDDGYQDNFQQAFPILLHYNFPAIIFLATNYIGNNKPFFWDLTAYCFAHTTKKTAVLPFIGSQQWHNETERIAVMNQWLHYLKTQLNHEKETAIQQLPDILDITITQDTFADVCLDWEQVRAMSQAGITFGAHTHNHPILTRIPLAEAWEEITTSQTRIMAETGDDVFSFAYPNGLTSDFNQSLMNILQEIGIQASFTLLSGPAKPREVQQNALAIRRIFISHRDDLPRFAAKVMGVNRLMGE